MRRLALMLTIVSWAIFGAVPVQGLEDGAQFSEPEQQATMETFQFALENNRTNEAAAWVNPDTGSSGSLVPVRTYQNQDGTYCREYITTITIGGEEEQGYGTACRQADGTWMIVSGEPAGIEGGTQTGAPSGRTVYLVRPYPYGDPTWYYDYPYYTWDPYYPHVFFSFDIVYFSGHRHYHPRPFAPWFHAHRWHHLGPAIRPHPGRPFLESHPTGRVVNRPALISPGSGGQHFRHFLPRHDVTGRFDRGRDGGGRHVEGMRPFAPSGRIGGVIPRSFVGHGFEGRKDWRGKDGFGGRHSFGGGGRP